MRKENQLWALPLAGPTLSTITDGVFSHIAQYKKYCHNNSTNCEKKIMARKLWASSTRSYNFCSSKTMLKHWNGLKEMDLVFSHFCHTRVTQNPIGTSQIFDPGMSPQTDTSLGVWTEAADFTSPIYRTRSYIPTLQPSIVTLKTAANAEHQRITWYLNIFITNQPSTDIQFNFATEL